jgi:hypothetical protein
MILLLSAMMSSPVFSVSMSMTTCREPIDKRGEGEASASLSATGVQDASDSSRCHLRSWLQHSGPSP